MSTLSLPLFRRNTNYEGSIAESTTDTLTDFTLSSQPLHQARFNVGFKDLLKTGTTKKRGWKSAAEAFRNVNQDNLVKPLRGRVDIKFSDEKYLSYKKGDVMYTDGVLKMVVSMAKSAPAVGRAFACASMHHYNKGTLVVVAMNSKGDVGYVFKDDVVEAVDLPDRVVVSDAATVTNLSIADDA